MAAPVDEARTGELLSGRFQLGERIASDAISESYAASEQRGGAPVEVRVLRPEFALQPKIVQRFARTPKLLEGFQHPSVARVLAVGSDDTGIPFVAVERLGDEPLARALAGFPEGMPVGVALNLLTPVIDGLAELHALGVVHTKLDLECIALVRQGGATLPKLTGLWGEAEAEARGASGSLRAPERNRRGAAPDPRIDVWSIGALLYQTLSGQPPATGSRTHAPLAELVPHLPPQVSELVERCLARDPGKRPAHAGEVRDALLAASQALRAAPASGATASARRKAPAPEQALAPLAEVTLEPARTPPAPKPKPASKPEKPEARVAFELGATLAAQPAPIERPPAAKPAPAAAKPARIAEPLRAAEPPPPSASRDASPPPLGPLPTPSQIDALLPRADALTKVEPTLPAPSLPAPPPQPVEQKTMSDLAAAFGPMEGEDRIGQAEVEGAPRAREFRKTMDAADARAKEKAQARASSVGEGGRRPSRADTTPKAVPLASPKQLREATAPRPSGLSEEQLQRFKQTAFDAQRERRRRLFELLIILFAFLLVFALPLLWDASRQKAEAQLGAQLRPAVLGLALLSIVALVRVSALSREGHSFMLRPVKISLQVVTTSICLLAASYFLPFGALGPAEVAARYALPWGSGAFLFFGGVHGLLGAVRQASSSPFLGIAAAVLYCGGFFGSYRAVASTALAGGFRRGQAHAAGAGVRAAGPRGLLGDLKGFASGQVKPPDAGAHGGILQQKEVGGSEKQDMEAVEHIYEQRRAEGQKMRALSKDVQKLAQ